MEAGFIEIVLKLTAGSKNYGSGFSNSPGLLVAEEQTSQTGGIGFKSMVLGLLYAEVRKLSKISSTQSRKPTM